MAQILRVTVRPQADRGGRRRSQSGQVLVESALAFPVLLLATIGLVQFALFAHAQHVVTGAVQEGARLAAAEERTLTEGVTYAQTLLQAGLGGSAKDVMVQGTDNGLTITVTARGQLRTMIPWVADVELPLQAQTTMHKEQFHAGPGP